ncbi:hypothetical protein SCLCIDRAFT_18895 [Scleroderma citrinum Foug A]|uniref:Uncharacterized protein n=1 Tax=Scleroderma citrinum Foug A TaxID=1036808 RepID=A0A0C3ESX6_9AGAM|nr:hypothetical protein SCLCIDRAFT_18895 [Scleroderma citrinum Foug A]
MSFSTSSDFAAPRLSSPFDFNSDDYQSQVLDEWYHKHAATHANHFSVEGTYIEQTGDLDIDEVSPDEDDRAAESLVRKHWHAGEH